MRAVIYTLLFTLGFSGICQHAHASTHSRKYTHHTLRLIKEQVADRENLVGDEDDDDQDDLTRKFFVPVKWLTAAGHTFFTSNPSLSHNKLSAAHSLSPPLGDICISCRVLRI